MFRSLDIHLARILMRIRSVKCITHHQSWYSDESGTTALFFSWSNSSNHWIPMISRCTSCLCVIDLFSDLGPNITYHQGLLLRINYISIFQSKSIFKQFHQGSLRLSSGIAYWNDFDAAIVALSSSFLFHQRISTIYPKQYYSYRDFANKWSLLFIQSFVFRSLLSNTNDKLHVETAERGLALHHMTSIVSMWMKRKAHQLDSKCKKKRDRSVHREATQKRIIADFAILLLKSEHILECS